MDKVSNRNYGIDLLRIIALIGVIILHVMGHGKVLSTSTDNLHFASNWFLEILAYPAVNCFVLISGFVGYRAGNPFPKAKNLISLWFTVFFYSVFICLLLFALFPNQIEKFEILKSFLPVLSNRYWFFTSYFGLFLLSPALNALVDSADRTTALWLGTIIAVIFSVSTVLHDPFKLSNGYSVLWFLILYLLGALLKKFEITTRFSPWLFLLLTVGSFLITYFSKLAELFKNIPIAIFISKINGSIISYSSPTVLLTAIGAVCLFSRIPINKVVQKTISFFAPAAFSVYLIHDNPAFRRLIMSGGFSFLNDYSPLITIIMAVGSVVAIFLVCAMVDKVREGLFKLLRINKLAEWIVEIPLKITGMSKKSVG